MRRVEVRVESARRRLKMKNYSMKERIKSVKEVKEGEKRIV